MPRPKTKTHATTIRLSPSIRAAWEAAAAAEQRSLTNMFEVAIHEYIKRHKIPLPAQTPSSSPKN